MRVKEKKPNEIMTIIITIGTGFYRIAVLENARDFFGKFGEGWSETL